MGSLSSESTKINTLHTGDLVILGLLLNYCLLEFSILYLAQIEKYLANLEPNHAILSNSIVSRKWIVQKYLAFLSHLPHWPGYSWPKFFVSIFFQSIIDFFVKNELHMIRPLF